MIQRNAEIVIIDDTPDEVASLLKLLNRNVPVFESVDLAGKVLDHLNTYREFLQKHGKYPKN